MMNATEINELLARPTITVEQAANIMGMSRNAAYDAVKEGDLPSFRMGKRIFVPTAALRQKLKMEIA